MGRGGGLAQSGLTPERPATAGIGAGMDQPRPPLFAFSEADHLTRIHLRLALEDIGFTVEEAADKLRLADGGPGAMPEPPCGDQ